MKPEYNWLPPCTAITGALIFASIISIPFSGYMSPPPFYDFVVNWFWLMTLLGGTWALGFAILLMIRRVHSPISEISTWILRNRRKLFLVFFGFILTGLIQLAFNWLKPQISIIFPFWADRMLADIDKMVFGTDPGPVVRLEIDNWLPFLDWIYSLWYPATLLALFGVLVTNRAKSILAYFLLWGVFGPLVQAPLSSAGPIFWSRLGFGNRFDVLVNDLPFGTANAANYLWRHYTAQTSDIAVGISAMPSMHVGMATWIALSCWRTPFAPAGVMYWAAVFLGSVALGWHYVIDGIVGSLGALACNKGAGAVLQRSHKRAQTTLQHPN